MFLIFIKYEIIKDKIKADNIVLRDKFINLIFIKTISSYLIKSKIKIIICKYKSERIKLFIIIYKIKCSH